SGAWKEKGRTSSLLAILESPCFEDWLARASPAATPCSGRRLTAPAAAEAPRTRRRVGDDEFAAMVSPPKGAFTASTVETIWDSRRSACGNSWKSDSGR